MSKKEVLFELLDDNIRRIHKLLMAPENDFLYWSPDGEGNNLLCEHFGIEMPAGYHEFALRDRQS